MAETPPMIVELTNCRALTDATTGRRCGAPAEITMRRWVQDSAGTVPYAETACLADPSHVLRIKAVEAIVTSTVEFDLTPVPRDGD